MEKKSSAIAVAMLHRGNAFLTTPTHPPCPHVSDKGPLALLTAPTSPCINANCCLVSQSSTADCMKLFWTLGHEFISDGKQERLFLTRPDRQTNLCSTEVVQFLCYEGIKGQTCAKSNLEPRFPVGSVRPRGTRPAGSAAPTIPGSRSAVTTFLEPAVVTLWMYL